MNTIKVSNSLDPDQVRLSVVPYLGPNCLQRLSADCTSIHNYSNTTIVVKRSAVAKR